MAASSFLPRLELMGRTQSELIRSVTRDMCIPDAAQHIAHSTLIIKDDSTFLTIRKCRNIPREKEMISCTVLEHRQVVLHHLQGGPLDPQVLVQPRLSAQGLLPIRARAVLELISARNIVERF